MSNEEYTRDRADPYSLRVYLDGFADLHPLGLDWKRMRKYPYEFPDRHIAKVSSLRTVVGMDFPDSSGRIHRLYMKRSFTRGLMKQILGRLRPSKEWREMAVARAFLSEGITVPRPVYYSETTSEGLPTRFLATEALDDRWKCLVDWVGDNGLEVERWEALAHWTRDIHRRGILHADYRADHIFLDPDGPVGEWALIDLDGSRTNAPVIHTHARRAILQLVQSLVPRGINLVAIRTFIEIYDREGKLGIKAEDLLQAAHENIKNRPPKTK